MVSPWMLNGTAISYVKGNPDIDRRLLVRSFRFLHRLLSLNLSVKQLIQAAQGIDYLHKHDPVVIHGDIRGVRSSYPRIDPLYLDKIAHYTHTHTSLSPMSLYRLLGTLSSVILACRRQRTITVVPANGVARGTRAGWPWSRWKRRIDRLGQRPPMSFPMADLP